VGEPSVRTDHPSGIVKAFGCGLHLIIEDGTDDLYAEFSLRKEKHLVFIAARDEELAQADIRRLIVSAILHTAPQDSGAKKPPQPGLTDVTPQPPANNPRSHRRSRTRRQAVAST
jgi:hypothetical protein